MSKGSADRTKKFDTYRDNWEDIFGKKPLCPFCEEARLELVGEYDHWQTDHYECPKCDSTYPTSVVQKTVEYRVQKFKTNFELTEECKSFMI